MRLARLCTASLAASARHAPVRSLVSISDSFDGGNIDLVKSSNGSVQIKIRPDPHTLLEDKEHMQWFAFRATGGESDGTTKYEIINAADVSFPDAWVGTEVVASTDRSTWTYAPLHRPPSEPFTTAAALSERRAIRVSRDTRRVGSTVYDTSRGVLSWEWKHVAPGVPVYFAYFDLYSYERHLDFVARCAAARDAPGLMVRSLGQTLDGREMDCIDVGTGTQHAWVIHRQHPGESMASFFAEGLLGRLLGLHAGGGVDPLSQRLLKEFTFHIVPNMNPDGALRGHLRTNAGGANLNREWSPSTLPSGATYEAPTLERSPEVYHVLKAMDATGVDLFLDVHGDETLPVAFLAGAEGLDVWEKGPRLRALHGAFVGAYSRANPDMQRPFGYEPGTPANANYCIGSNQVASRFDCLGVTLEMPFKDCVGVARPAGQTRGFDGMRAAQLGAALLDALAYVAPSLRGVDNPVFVREDDAYVAPVEDLAEIAKWAEAR